MKFTTAAAAVLLALISSIVYASPAEATTSCGRWERKIASIQKNIDRSKAKQNKLLLDTEAKEARYRLKQRAYLDAASALDQACHDGNARACSRQQRYYAAYEKVEVKIRAAWDTMSVKWEALDAKIARFYLQLSEAHDRLGQCQAPQNP